MPARLSDIKRAVERLGCEVLRPSSGSHWRIRRGGTTYPIPAHRGLHTEIPDIYIRKLCAALQLDEDALRKLL